MKWTNESSSIQTVKEKHHSEAFRITGIPKRLRYSPDSSNTFMHKQHQVSGAVLSPASVRAWSLKTSSLATWAVWAATGNSPGTRLLLKQMLAFMNCGISSGLDFAPHFSVNQLCQECLGISVQKLTRNMTQCEMCAGEQSRMRIGRTDAKWILFSMSICGLCAVWCSTSGYWNCIYWNQWVLLALCVELLLRELALPGISPQPCMRSLSGAQALNFCLSHRCVWGFARARVLKRAVVVLYSSPLLW